MKKYIVKKFKSVISKIIHRFILFLLNVSKSKYKLINSRGEVSINYKNLDVFKVRAQIKSPYVSEVINDVSLEQHRVRTAHEKLRKQLVNHILLDQLIEYSIYTALNNQEILQAEIKVVKP